MPYNQTGPTNTAQIGTFNDVNRDQYNTITNNFINNLASELAELVKSRALGAAFNASNLQSTPRCLEGTRTEALKTIKDSIEGKASKPITWMYGLAGSGKRTISLTLADAYASEGKLAASFFFSKDDPELDNLKRLVPTLASQLIVAIPQLKDVLQKALQDDPTLKDQSFRPQFQKLILEPLAQVPQHNESMVIIIDALHHCKDHNAVKEFLTLLGEAVKGGKLPFRILLGSRSEAFLQHIFQDFADKKLASIVCLDNFAVDDDIRKFLRQRLAEVHADRELAVAQPWPSDEELTLLVSTAGDLFLHAVTIVDFINKPNENPVQQLKTILKGKSRRKASVFTTLDTFYKSVVSSLAFDEHTRDIVGTISLLREPLSLRDLDALLKLQKGESRQMLSGWQAVISVPSNKETSKPVQLVHTPLWQYLTDKKRSATFAIDAAWQHSMVAIKCIDLMTKEFGLIVLLGVKKKPSPALLYACRHWNYHLTHGLLGPAVRGCLKSLKFRTLVGWVRTLGQVGELNRIFWALSAVREWMKNKPEAPAALLRRFRYIEIVFKSAKTPGAKSLVEEDEVDGEEEEDVQIKA